jgi:hypothetical protein
VDALARQRVTLWKEGLPDRTVWLVIKRPLGAAPSSTYALSHAPASTPWRLFVWLSGRRGAVAQGFEEGQTELGRDHDEVRQYPGWHHHLLTTRLAPFCLWHLKLPVGEKSAGPHRVAGADPVGRRLTLADVYGCRRAGVHRVGAAAQPPSVSSASGATTRGRMRRGRERFYTIEIIFVVNNCFQTAIAPPQVPAPEETEDVESTTSGEYPK